MLALSYSADTLTGSLENLLEVARQNANKEIADGMKDTLDTVGKLDDSYEEQIQRLKDEKEEIEGLKNGVELDLSNPADATSLRVLNEKIQKWGVDTTSTYTSSGFCTITLDFEEGTARNNYENAKNVIDKQINDFEKDQESSWKKINPIATAWAQTTPDYDTLSTEMQNVLTKIFGNIDYSEIETTNEAELKKYLTEHYITPFTDATFEVKTAYSELLNLDTSKLSFSDYQKKLKELSNLIFEEMGEDMNLSSWTDVLAQVGLDEYYETCTTARDNIIETFEDVPEKIIDSLSTSDIVEAWDVIETDIVSSWDEFTTYMESKKIVDLFDTSKLEDLQTNLENVKKAYTGVSSIISDYNENGYYTSENLKSLLELEPEYINVLIDENGQINLNSESYKKYVASKAQTLVLTQVKSLYENILAMTEEEAQAYANATAYKTEGDSLSSLISSMTDYYAIMAATKDSENNTTYYTEALSRSVKTAANYVAVYDSWLNSLSTSTNEFTAATESSTTATDKSKTALEEQKEALEEQKEVLEEQKESLEDYKQSLEDAQAVFKSAILKHTLRYFCYIARKINRY